MKKLIGQSYSAALRLLFGLVLGVVVLGSATGLHADCQVTLQWDPNTPAPDGYHVYQREYGSTYNYRQYEDAGQTNTYTVYGLADNTTYHFVVRAYVGFDESGNSNEATFDCNGGSAGGGSPTTDANPPAQPNTITPIDNAIDVSLQPDFVTSAFYDPDPGDYHTQTRWQIFRVDNDVCVYDVVSNSALTRLTLPSWVLDGFTAYYWTVSYYNQNGGISAPAPVAYFTTKQADEAATPPVTLAGGGSSSGSGGGGSAGGCFIQTLFEE